MSDDCDPILVAGDEGEVLREGAIPPGAQVDRSADGSITFVSTADGECRIHVDTTTAFGGRLARIARKRGETPEECVLDAVREFIDEQREQRDEKTTCGHCGERFDASETRGTFDGSRARYVCPHCSKGTDGPLPPFGERR